MLYYMNWLAHDFWTLTGGWEFDHSHGAGTSSPSHWQQVEEQAPKPVGWMICFLLMTFAPVQKLCLNIYMQFLYEFCYRTYICIYICIYIYIYMQQECHSILVKLHPITFYRTVFLGSAQSQGWMPLFVFFGFQLCLALWWYSLIPGCLWLMGFILNNTLVLGIWCTTIPHLPGCFYPWTFFQNIGFNMMPSDPFMSHLATQLGYSAGEFRALQLIVLATFGVVD